MNAIHTRWLTMFVLLCIMAAGTAYRLQIANLDMESLLQGYLQDDAFYYYMIAKFIHAVHFATFDGVVPTNGFHPLWLLMVLPFFKVADANAVIYTQYLSVMLGTLTILTVYLASVRLTTNKPLSLAAAAVFAIDAPIVWLHFNGLETTLNSLVLLLLLLSSFPVLAAQHVSRTALLLFGVMSALAFLTRTDNAILLLVCYLPILLRAYRTHRWHEFLLPVMTCAALCLPWLLWNVANFGSIVQISGQNGGGLQNLILPELSETGLRLLQVLYFFCERFSDVFRLLISDSTTLGPLAGLLTMSAIGIFLSQQQWHHIPRHDFTALLMFIIGISMTFMYHAGVRTFVRSWYLAPLVLGLLLIISLLLAACVRRIKLSYQPIASIVLACTWLALVIYYFPPIVRHANPDIRQTLHLPAWLNQHTPPDAVLGSLNTGIFAYFTQRTFVNLDGVVDENAFQARMNNNLPSYVHKRNVRYTVDVWGSQQFTCQQNPWYACKEVYRYGGGNNPGLVMELIPHTAAP